MQEVLATSRNLEKQYSVMYAIHAHCALHSPLARLFLDQSARNFGSMPKIKFSDHLIFYFFHYEEALTSLRLPRGAGGDQKPR